VRHFICANNKIIEFDEYDMNLPSGYDTSYFLNSIEQSYICVICHQGVKDPQMCWECQCNCCRKCLKKWINGGNNRGCPVCRRRDKGTAPNRALDELIKALPVRCSSLTRTKATYRRQITVPETPVDNRSSVPTA
jgi:hypothetical protein